MFVCVGELLQVPVKSETTDPRVTVEGFYNIMDTVLFYLVVRETIEILEVTK